MTQMQLLGHFGLQLQACLTSLPLDAGPLQAVAQAYAIFFSIGSMAIQLHSFCAAIVFMDQYAATFNFPRPLLLPAQAQLKASCLLLAGVRGKVAFED